MATVAVVGEIEEAVAVVETCSSGGGGSIMVANKGWFHKQVTLIATVAVRLLTATTASLTLKTAAAAVKIADRLHSCVGVLTVKATTASLHHQRHYSLQVCLLPCPAKPRPRHILATDFHGTPPSACPSLLPCPALLQASLNYRIPITSCALVCLS